MLAFLVVPIIELYLFVQVADAVGFGSALFWIVGVSVVGAWLVKREGLGALRRANAKVNRGEIPTDEIINGILIVIAGALMLTPGFLTDAVGLLLLIPPTRAVLRVGLRKRFAAGPVIIGSFGRGPFGPTGDPRHGAPGGDVWDAESWETGDWDAPRDRPDDPPRELG